MVQKIVQKRPITMLQNRLLKKDQTILQDMSEVTPEFLEFLNDLLAKNVSPRNIWYAIPLTFRQNKEILNSFYKAIHKYNLRVMKRLFEEENIWSSELFSYLKENNEEVNEEFFKLCMQSNNFPFDDLISIIKEQPELVNFLTDKATLQKLVEIYPEVTEHLQSDVFDINTENLTVETIEKTSFWMKNGEIPQHFELLGNVKFKSREDYIKFVQAYIQEDKSIPQFCDKYFIDNITGFSKVLDTIENEDNNLAEQILEVKKHAQERYISSMKDLIEQVIDGKITLQEARKSWPRLGAYDFINAESYIDNEKYIKLLGSLVLEMGIKDGRLKTEEIDENGVTYSHFGKIPFEELVKWFSNKDNSIAQAHDVGEGINIICGKLRYSSNDSKLILFNKEKLFQQINEFEQPLKINEYLNNLLFINENGETIKPTEENVQDAIKYMEATDRFICHKNMKETLRHIVKGKLSKGTIDKAIEKKRLQTEREQKNKEAKQKRVLNTSDINEYLQSINSKKEKEDEVLPIAENLMENAQSIASNRLLRNVDKTTKEIKSGVIEIEHPELSSDSQKTEI